MIDAQAELQRKLAEIHARSVELAKNAVLVFPELRNRPRFDFSYDFSAKDSTSVSYDQNPSMRTTRDWLEYASIILKSDFGFWNKLALQRKPWPKDTKLVVNREFQHNGSFHGILTWEPQGQINVSSAEGVAHSVMDDVLKKIAQRPQSISAIIVPEDAEQLILNGHVKAENYRKTRQY